VCELAAVIAAVYGRRPASPADAIGVTNPFHPTGSSNRIIQPGHPTGSSNRDSTLVPSYGAVTADAASMAAFTSGAYPLA
jgi:hypothetical protein